MDCDLLAWITIIALDCMRILVEFAVLVGTNWMKAQVVVWSIHSRVTTSIYIKKVESQQTVASVSWGFTSLIGGYKLHIKVYFYKVGFHLSSTNQLLYYKVLKAYTKYK